jgi:hypothetical protein
LLSARVTAFEQPLQVIVTLSSVVGCNKARFFLHGKCMFLHG